MRFLPVVNCDGKSVAVNLDNVLCIEQTKCPSSPRMGEPMLIFKYPNGTTTNVYGTFDDIRKDIFCGSPLTSS